jgi:hypothetical protein
MNGDELAAGFKWGTEGRMFGEEKVGDFLHPISDSLYRSYPHSVTISSHGLVSLRTVTRGPYPCPSSESLLG